MESLLSSKRLNFLSDHQVLAINVHKNILLMNLFKIKKHTLVTKFLFYGPSHLVTTYKCYKPHNGVITVVRIHELWINPSPSKV